MFINSLPEPGRKMRVSNGSGFLPVWSKDGKEIFYITLEGQMMATEITERAGGISASVPKPLFHAGLGR